jgi:glycosyltransferase involved in cell wall biosynthesis
MSASMSDCKTIVVDLTPLLPGAVNGGAKILVLELLRLLPELRPETRFVLLTRRSSHDELAQFERANVTRKLVWNDLEARNDRRPRIPDWLLQQTAALTRRLPAWLQRMRYDVRRLMANPAASADGGLAPTLLFSPFGLSESFVGMEFSPADQPTVAILYDLQHRRYPEFFEAAEVAKREGNLRRHGAASVMAAISNFVRDSAIEAGVIAESAISTVYIRLQHRIARVDGRRAEQVLHGLGLSAGRYLLYPANFWPHKNHDALLEAFSIARSDGLPVDLKLVCTGAPCERSAAVATAADALGLRQAVVIPGFLDDAQFAALLRCARGVVFPSLYEGFGMPVIEAMAVECPVACSNTTSLCEVTGDAALLFDPGRPADIARAINRLATDEALRATLIEQGLRRAETFADTGRMAREYLHLFDDAIERWNNRSVDQGQERLQGVHGDGWAAPLIVVRYGQGSGERSLRVELQIPDWLPIRHYELSVNTAKGDRLALHRLRPGDAPIIEVPIGPEAGAREVRIKPFFRPIELRELAKSADSRELTVIVRRVEIRDAKESITMYPRTRAA